MARSRMIKPEFWNDEKLSKLSMQARLLYVGMWNQSDDYGSVKGNPAWLKSMVFPFDEVSLKTFTGWLTELSVIHRIFAYEANNELYYYMPYFVIHQRINRPSETRNPAPPDALIEESMSTRGRSISINRSISISETEENTSCAEPVPVSPPVIELALNDKTYFQVTELDVQEWTGLYQVVDINAELVKMKGWLTANDKRRPTKKGIKRFINQWLSKAYDDARKRNNGTYKQNTRESKQPNKTEYERLILDNIR